MKQQRLYEKLILFLELVGFGGVLLIIWLDEYIDIPFRYFGAHRTPARPQEFGLKPLPFFSSASRW